ncbi:MAG: MopE-related protein [Myxococcota bacterium]
MSSAACARPEDGDAIILFEPEVLDFGALYPTQTSRRMLSLVDLRDGGATPTLPVLRVEGQGQNWFQVVPDVVTPGPFSDVVRVELSVVVPIDAPQGAYTARLAARDGESAATDISVLIPVLFDVLPCDQDGDSDLRLECGGGDCDDNDPLRNRFARERCNGVDDDCNGLIDDTADLDLDGFVGCEDCDDDNSEIFPGAPERCNGLDDDCDGQVGPLERDLDGDGVSECEGDCNDRLDTVFPGAPEQCNGLDDDCDGVPDDREDDDGDGFNICDDCDDRDELTFPGAPELCDGLDNDCDEVIPPSEMDGDGDGVAECGGDCDDADPERFPGNPDVCNGADDNCDDVIDEPTACPCTRQENGGNIYLFCNYQQPWAGAQSACNSWNYDLLTVDSFDEDEFAQTWLRNVNSSTPWWMGFNDRSREGDWVWEDGTAVTYTNWETGEPNDQGGEDCGQLNFFLNGAWNDQACSLRYPFICELD